jgi:hypothetical protein
MFSDQPTARDLAERGIAESHDHAEEGEAGWTDRAIAKVEAFSRQTEFFLAEECKAWAYGDGLSVPPVDGAWGQVMRSAASRGIVHSFGRKAATSPGSHGKLMTLWRRGPGNVAEPAITAEQVDDDVRFITELAAQMKNEGRIFIYEPLLRVARNIRALASDL